MSKIGEAPKVLNKEDERQFLAAMQSRNLALAPGKRLIADGQWHRCDVIDKPSGKNDGCYVLHLDGPAPWGLYRNWTDGQDLDHWRGDRNRQLTDAELEEFERRMEEARVAAEKIAAEMAEAAAKRAMQWWGHAKAASSSHPYLKRKGIKPHGILVDDLGRLLVPMFTVDGELVNLQLIDGDGNKSFLRGGQTKGCAYKVKGEGRTVIEAEGFATAATINEATGLDVVVAFSAGNLAEVASLIRNDMHAENSWVAKVHEERELQRERPVKFWDKFIIAVDDDWKTANNPGIMQGLAAARITHALVAQPYFGKNRKEKETDFNDLAKKYGLEAVEEDIARAVEPQVLLEKRLLADPHSAHSKLIVEELAAWRQLDRVFYEKLLAELKRKGVRQRPLEIAVKRAKARAAAPPPSDAAVILSTQTPLRSAEEFVKRQFDADGSAGLVHYRGDFYQWTRRHYEQLENDGLVSLLYLFLDKAVTSGRYGYEPFNPDNNKVNKVLHALAAGVQEKAQPNAPFWIGSTQHTEDPTKLIACRNGLFNLETGELLPHTPHFFNVNCLPFDYDPDAPKYPTQWLRFLRQLWPGNADGKIARFALQEMFGLMLTLDTAYQKIFCIIGPKRSGKGTIARILRAMLGKDNVAGPTLASLSSHFGLWPLINKQAAIISDARLGKGSNIQAIAERLLSISGEDALTIDRKYKDAWTGQLSARFLILSNELPQIPDASGALASRFVILMLTTSFYGKEDLLLTDKLLTELPGILNWALAGLERLRKRGYFKMPEASLAAIRQLENLASPVRAFLRDWCHTSDANAKVQVKELYTAYRHWCGEHGIGVGNSIVFGRNLHAALPNVKARGRGDGRRYIGVRLSREGRIQYAAAQVAKTEKKSVPDDE
jgi:putative DNA primase/helicase